MGYNGASIDAYINLDISPFTEKLDTVKNELKSLQESFTDMPTTISKSIESLANLNEALTKATTQAKEIKTALDNASHIQTLRSEITKLREELTLVKTEVESLKTGFSGVSANITKSASELSQMSTVARAVATDGNSIKQSFYSLDSALVKSLTSMNSFQIMSHQFTSYIKQMPEYLTQINNAWNRINTSASQSVAMVKQTAQSLINVHNDWNSIKVTANEVNTTYSKHFQELVKQGQELLKIQDYQGVILTKDQQRLVKLAEEVNLIREVENATITLSEIQYSNINLLKQQVTEMNLLAQGIQKGAINADAYNLSLEKASTTGRTLQEITAQLFKLSIEQGSSVRNRLTYEEEELAIRKQFIGIEEELKSVYATETAEYEKQLALLQKELALEEEIASASKSKSTSGSTKNSLDTNILRRTGSMFVTMALFNEAMDIAEGSITAANGLKQLDYWQTRLTKDLGYSNTAFSKLKQSLYDTYQGGKSLAELYPKVDMTSVASSTLEAVDKYKLAGQDLSQLTEIYAVASSQFAKEGRTQEDSILAVNDALDGEFRRLKEIGITQDSLIANGWNGDLEDKASLIQALNKNMEAMGYKQTAQDITSVSEALEVLKVKLETAFGRFINFISPALIVSFEQIIWFIDLLVDAGNALYNGLDAIIPDEANGALTTFAGTLITLGAGIYVVRKLATSFGLLNKAGGSSVSIFGKLKGIFGGKETTSTGGIIGGNTYSGNWKTTMKEGFLGQIEQLGKDIGMYARVIVGVTAIMATIWVALEELNLIGQRYASIEAGVKKGVQAITDTAVVIAPIIVGVTALNIALEKLDLAGLGTMSGFKQSAVALAQIMLETAMVIGLLAPAIWVIQGIGWLFNQSQVTKGVAIIKETAIVIVPIAVAIGILGAVFSLPIIGELETGLLAKGMLEGALILAEVMVLTAGVIASLSAPIASICAIGNSFDSNKVVQGATIIKQTATALSNLADAMGSLTEIAWDNFANVVIGTDVQRELNNITDNVIPALKTFANKFNAQINGMVAVDSGAVTKLQQTANTLNLVNTAITSVMNAYTKLKQNNMLNPEVFDKVLNTNILGALKKIKEFLGNLQSEGFGGSASIDISGITNTINALNNGVAQLSSTLKSKAQTLETDAKALGTAIPKGFKEGASSLSSAVSSTITTGLNAVSRMFGSAKSQGKYLAHNLVTGYKAEVTNKIYQISYDEIHRTLVYFSKNLQNFYDKGFQLGQSFANGYRDGDDINSPGIVARSTAQELVYALQSMDDAVGKMYKGGYALGNSLAQGYGKGTTDMSLVKSGASRSGKNSGVLNITSAKNGSTTTNNNKKNVQVVNLNFDGATFYGSDDVKAKMQSIAEEVFYGLHSSSNYSGI